MLLIPGHPGGLWPRSDAGPGSAPHPRAALRALESGVRGPGVVLPPAVEVTAHVLWLLLLAVETVWAISQAALDVSWKSLAWELVTAGLSHLDWALV